MTQKHIYNRLRFYREQAGLSQIAIAHQLGLACADRISRWENGLTYPHVVNLFKLAAIYKVTAEELYKEPADPKE